MYPEMAASVQCLSMAAAGSKHARMLTLSRKRHVAKPFACSRAAQFHRRLERQIMQVGVALSQAVDRVSRRVILLHKVVLYAFGLRRAEDRGKVQ